MDSNLEITGGVSKASFLGIKDGWNCFPGWQVIVVNGERDVKEIDQKRSFLSISDWSTNGFDHITLEEHIMMHAEAVIAPFDNFSFNSGSGELLTGTYYPHAHVACAGGTALTSQSGTHSLQISSISLSYDSEIIYHYTPRRAVRII